VPDVGIVNLLVISTQLALLSVAESAEVATFKSGEVE